MIAVDAFVNEWLGRGLDTDGYPPSQPFQCYDVFIQYNREVVGCSAYVSARVTGLAQDMWTDFANTVLPQFYTQIAWNQPGVKGDVAIWGRTPATPDSHITVLLADNGTSQHIFGQNQPQPICTIRDLASAGLLGYLRPKQLTEGDEPMITDQDNEYWRWNKLGYQIRGRNFARAEFQASAVGQTWLRAMEILSDDAEADAATAAQELGQLATRDNWQGQIYGLEDSLKSATGNIASLQAQVTSLALNPTVEQLTAVQTTLAAAVQQAQDDQTKLDALTAQNTAATTTGNSFLLWLGGILNSLTGKGK
jgi:hypothetical protein